MIDCIEYTGYRDKKGYGRQYRNGAQRLVHRLAYEDYYGPIPAGLHVCHKCDNPACYNVEHLFLGTAADNNRDRDAKGRNGHANKAHCKNGHEYSSKNTYVNSVGARECRTCKYTSRKRSKERVG